MVKRAAIIGSQSLEFNGETERNVIQVAKIIHSLGYDVTIFTPVNFEDKGKKIDSFFFTYNNTAFNRDFFGKKFILKITRGLSIGLIGALSFRYIFSKIKNYDFYYFVNPNFLFSKSMKYFYLNNMHPEIILGNHGTYFEILDRKLYRKPLLRVLNFLIFYYAKRNAIKIQVQNDAQHSFYNSIGIPPGSLLDIPQCIVDFDKYSIEAHKGFNIVFFNTFTNGKDLRILNDIIRKTDNDIDVLDYHQNIPKIEWKYVNRKNLTFHGYVSDKEKQKILAQSDLMIDTSKYESLSIPSIEGLASGSFIVAPDISGINTLKRLVPDGVSIVEKRKSEYYIEKIDYYSHLKSADPVEFERRQQLIRQEAKQQFDKTIIERLIKDMILKTPENENKISIVTASLNEGANIKRYLEQVMNLIRSKHIKSIDEIVIVDDGSTDNTISAIETFAKENTDIAISLVKRTKKMGTVDAQIAGANRAKNEYILVMDCDLQHPVEYIEKFVEKFNYGYDIIIGSRYIVGSKNSWEPEREVISRVATMIAHIMFPFTFKIKDPLAGYFLCKRSIIVNLKS